MQSMDFNDFHQKHGLHAVKDCISNAVLAEQNNKPNRFTPILFSGQNYLTKHEYLVKKLLDTKSMSVMFGESGCGKTFTAIDLAMRVALGQDWCGKKVRQYSVIYIAAEAGTGIYARMKAFRLHHGIKEDVPVYILTASPSLRGSSGDVNELIEEIRKIKSVGLIIIDTLSRTLAGGNENSSDDMGTFIINCDRIREEIACHVMIIHHSGKESGRGPRGHSLLRAAVDTEIEVTEEGGIIKAEVTKQRDGKSDDQFYFKLQEIELGKDEDGDPITSCALTPCTAPTKTQKLTGPAKVAFEVLQKLIAGKGKEHSHVAGMTVTAVSLDDFRTALKDSDISTSDKESAIKKAIKRAIEALEEANLVVRDQNFIWIHGQGDK